MEFFKKVAKLLLEAWVRAIVVALNILMTVADTVERIPLVKKFLNNPAGLFKKTAGLFKEALPRATAVAVVVLAVFFTVGVVTIGMGVIINHAEARDRAESALESEKNDLEIENNDLKRVVADLRTKAERREEDLVAAMKWYKGLERKYEDMVLERDILQEELGACETSPKHHLARKGR